MTLFKLLHEQLLVSHGLRERVCVCVCVKTLLSLLPLIIQSREHFS